MFIVEINKNLVDTTGDIGNLIINRNIIFASKECISDTKLKIIRINNEIWAVLGAHNAKLIKSLINLKHLSINNKHKLMILIKKIKNK